MQPATSRPALVVLVVSLGLPWFVHAAVVLSSGMGLCPLRSRLAADGILLGALAACLVLVRRVPTELGAGRAKTARAPSADSPVILALSKGLALAAASGFAIALVSAVTFPLVAYDALGYRLPTVAQWLHAGRIAWVVSDDPVRNGFPLGQEAIAAVLASATSTLRWSTLPSFFSVVAGAASIFILAERLGARRTFARAAAAVFVLVPMNALNAASGYVDAAFAGAVVSLACNAAVLAIEENPGMVFGVTTGMAASLVLSLKGNGVAFVGVTSLFVAYALVRGRRFSPPVMVALACALPGLFWVTRNVLHTGNPMWPIDVRVGPHRIFRGSATMERVLDVTHNTPPELGRLPSPLRVVYTWLELAGPASGFDDRLAGLGLAWPLLALPAAFALGVRALRRKTTSAEAPAVFVLLVTSACFAIQPLRWWPRYTIWVWGAGAISLSLVFERWARSKLHGRLIAAFAVLSALAIGEGANAAARANGLAVALGRIRAGARDLSNVEHAVNAASWVRPDFWQTGLGEQPDVCRGAWKRGTDDANLDGVFAQLSPRPRVHVIFDDHAPWSRVRADWRATPCASLLLFAGSPVLRDAAMDPTVTIAHAVAFDPLFIVTAAGVPQ